MTIETAQQQLTPKVMSLPGVVGIALGRHEGRPCLKVLVDDPPRTTSREIPVHYQGFKVVVDEVGTIRRR